ncbi:pectinesterase family protein [Rhodohalobacter sp. 8-1]|uniref:pectinesterase family protein n=1 Tax=Rhodohalobacter sp. 8-1 TaxID=3131972 RepID=UPI00403F4B09
MSLSVFINTDRDNRTIPKGWHNWNRPEAQETVFYGEFSNSGPGFMPVERVSWVKQLSTIEAGSYTPKKILWIASDNGQPTVVTPSLAVEGIRITN